MESHKNVLCHLVIVIGNKLNPTLSLGWILVLLESSLWQWWTKNTQSSRKEYKKARWQWTIEMREHYFFSLQVHSSRTTLQFLSCWIYVIQWLLFIAKFWPPNEKLIPMWMLFIQNGIPVLDGESESWNLTGIYQFSSIFPIKYKKNIGKKRFVRWFIYLFKTLFWRCRLWWKRHYI